MSMRHPLYLAIFAVCALCSSAFGVATVNSGTYSYNTAEPSSITYTRYNPSGYSMGQGTLDFSSGWGSTSSYSDLSGWDYVGQIGDASCIYLGNGWVLTAKHVVSGTSYTGSFTLSGSTYSIVSGNVVYIGDNTDLVMVYVGASATISLPSLTLSSTAISNYSTVVLVGYGAGGTNRAESWGTSLVYTTGTDITPSGYSYVTSDFLASSGSTYAVTGDSGGGAFYYNTATHTWVLAGVIESAGIGTYSSGSTAYITACMDVSEYYSEIEAVLTSAVPEPSTLTMAGAGLGALWWSWRKRQKRQG